MVVPVNSSRWTSGGGAAFSFVPRRFISRLQLIVGRLWWLWWFSALPGSIPRVTELPKGREERRRGLRSDPSSLLLLSRIISPPLPRDKLPRGAAPSLPPSSFLSLPLPLSLSLFPLSCTRDRPTERQINTTQPPQTPLDRCCSR